MGVELGKGLAATIQQQLENEHQERNHDSSTEQLIRYYHSNKLN